MPFPATKKKPDVAIAIGIPKPKGPDLSGPGPLSGKPDPEEAPPDADPMGETGEEASGADLMADAIKPLQDLGLSDADAQSTLAGMFEAMAACIRRKESPGESAEDMGGDMGSPPPGGGSPYDGRA